MEPTDEALVRRARGGDAEAFRALFDRYHRTVYRFAFAMSGDHARAEDIVQETFVAAYRGLKTLRGEAKLTTWLYAIARNLLAKSLRRREPHMDAVVVENATPEARMIDEETARTLSRALLELDEDKRTVFTLKVMEGLSYEEIAAITGTAVAKLKTDLFRAKARLRELLADFREGSR